MARLIKLTDRDGEAVWLNADKIVKVAEDATEPAKATIYHEPEHLGDLAWTDVMESPEQIARMANESPILSLAEPVEIAITEWPRGKLSINQ